MFFKFVQNNVVHLCSDLTLQIWKFYDLDDE